MPTLLAVGGGLASTPAAAIELGEVSVQSSLGQPLRASIAYALGPNEQLAGYCISIRPGAAASGLPAVARADISVANGVIALRGRQPAREPLMSVRLDVTCPYTPNISREYMLFLDPAKPLQAHEAPAAATQQPTDEIAIATPPVARAARVASTPVAPATPIDSSQRYRVQRGDSLSQIAQRIENRSVSLWGAVEQIFAANPGAFIDSDPNQLKAGSWLVIPDFGPTETTANDAPADVVSVERASFANTAVTNPAAPVESESLVEETASAVYPGVTTTDAITETTANDASAEVVPAEIVEESISAAPIEEVAEATDPIDDTAVLEPVAVPDMSDLQPGDVILDTDLDAPATANAPNVPVANILTADDTAGTSINWVLWLVGAGVALIAGLFMFGRRDRGAPAPEVMPAQPARRKTDAENTEELEAVADVDFDLADDSPTAENLALDADLEIGTGLEKGTDIDVAQDFGFAVTTHLDMELPEEPTDVDEKPETDIIAPLGIGQSSILKNEMLPDDDDYDMSVIVDATKMPMPEEVTERDLKAVVVDGGDETLISGDYTVSKEVDYDILEQDYEDEMTATQALNMEIEKAAAEIANKMDDQEDTVDVTAEMPLATVTPIDVTANLPSPSEDELIDTDETGVNEEITQEMIADDNTVEMPASKKDTKAS